MEMAKSKASKAVDAGQTKTGKRSRSKVERTENNSEIVVRQDEFTKFFQNMLSPRCRFLMPRLVSTPCAPQYLTATLNRRDLEFGTTYVWKVRPDIDNMFSELVEIPGGVNIEIGGSESFLFGQNGNAEFYSMSTVIMVGDGRPDLKSAPLPANVVAVSSPITMVIPRRSVNHATGYSGFFPYGSYYPTNMSNIGGYSVTIDNGDVAQDVQFQMVLVRNGPGGTLLGSAVQAVANNSLASNGTVTGNISNAAILAANALLGGIASQIEGFYFALAAESPYTFRVDANVNFGPITSWRDYSLWDLIGVQATDVQRQYGTSEYHVVTAFDCLMKNVTTEASRGGTLVAAQLPGKSENLIPAVADDIYRFLSERSYFRYGPDNLSEGCHYSYIPTRLPNWFFHQKNDESLTELSYALIAFTTPSASAASIVQKTEMNISFNVCYDLISTDLSLCYFQCPSDFHRLIDLYTAVASTTNPLSGNPSHREKIKSTLSRLWNSPELRDAAKKTGKALGSALLTAILV